ncbi:hypothetical protein C0J52_01000 [Blattella germanica]|nr:hypothetical protein C0J52_01000 [Blattella germanica]
MVQLDWKRLLSLSPEDLSEEEKDDLYASLIWYTPEGNIDAERLKVLFRVTQDVLKYKGEQVESLVVELDDLAVRQGEEEARRSQNLIEEIEELRAQLSLSKRNESLVSGEGSEIEELRQELVKCELHNEELLKELKEREKDILAEKREAEKFAGQVAQLEREKTELQRELIALQNEGSEQHSTTQRSDSPEKQQEMAEMIRQKNKHISQLLNDVEEQNVALRSQVQELVEQKLRRDSQLDDFSEALDSRVEEHILPSGLDPSTVAKLKNQLQQAEQKVQLLEGKLKDAEEDAQVKAQDATEMIIQLREYESGEYGLAEAVGEIKELRQQRRVRDKQIEDLQLGMPPGSPVRVDGILAQRKKEQLLMKVLQQQAERLEEEKEQLGMPPGSPVRVDGILAQRKKEQLLMKVLQQQAERLEEEKLQLKLENHNLSQQLSKILTHDSVDSSSKPLSHTVSIDQSSVKPLSRTASLDQPVIKKLSRTVSLNQSSFKQHSRALSLDQPNIRQLSHTLSFDQPSIKHLSHTLSFDQSSIKQLSRSVSLDQPEEGSQDEEKIDEMILQRLDQNEDVMAKEMRILKLDQAVVQLEDRLRDLTTENEALRQGMHEILDSIHNQDGSSAVQVESQSLERLLQALDVRHISGWYHPAMRLQAQLQSVEGSNTVLREQLRLTRQEESKSTQELQKALLRIEQLEQNEYEKMRGKNKNLEKKLEELNTNFNMMRHQMGLLYKQHSDEKAEWKTLQTNFDTEKEKLTTKADTLEAKVKEYEKHLAVLNQGEEEQKRLIAESAQNIALASANKVVLERKCKSLQNLENQLRKENNKLKDDMASIECMVTQRIGELQRHKNMLQDSVPLTVMEAANKQYSELTTKYRDLLQKEQTLVCESRLAARLEGELAVLQKDKEELQNALQQAREKVHSLEVLIEAVNKDMISLLSKKLATIELKELERNAELETQNSTLVQQNLDLQQLERDLRDNLLTFVSRDELQEVQDKLRKCEQEKIELKLEKDRLKEISDIAQEQIRNLELWKLSQEYQLDYMRRQILELQSTSDERSYYSNYHFIFRSLHQVIQDLRRQYSGSVPLSTHERLVLSLRRLSDERRDATERMHAAEKLAHEAVTAKEEVELKSRRQAEILQSQLQQAEERLHRLEDHIPTLEQQQISTERNWEQAQLSWEQMQSELYKQLAEYEITVGVGKSQPLPKPQATDDQSDNPAVEQLKQALSLISTQSQNLLKYEGELAQLRSKVNSLTQLVEEKDMLLQTKEKALTEMQMQLISSRISPDTGEHPLEMLKIEEDSMEKLALKANSLQNIVNQKEETIGRYQQLLKEGRDEHSQAAARFQEELRNLNTTLNALQQAHSKLKSKLRHPSPNRKPIQNMVDQYIFQIQGLEDEVAELHTRLGNLSNQLQSSRQEADRWRNLAEERLNNMGELRKSAKQDLALVQEELKKQVEAAQRGPSAVMQNCISMLRSQLKDKEAQEQLLQQTIADLQKEMQQLMETPSRDIDDQPALPNRMLQTEVSNLKKQVKMAKDEANRLREQLSNRLKASSKREASLERNSENLHKKIRDLEDQLKQDKEKFENESRRVKSAEEVARWDERKKWQQTVEKLKQKLKEKSNEMERLQASVNSLRDTIARLEREKFVLDNRLRASKSAATSETKLETLELEKSKLENEVSTLRNKLEMQQHHSGGLGTVMLQERLEAQQRRIAVLELAKKGNSAVSDELEKLKEINATLQKANLHLEAENLEFRLELEKYRADTPRLREQVQHLEAYVSLLKSETSSQKEDESEHKSKKSPAELEKTIVALKRVVEKLQNDKKKLKEEQKKLSLQSVGQLLHKARLLDQVKTLLQRAAAKEKALHEKVSELQRRHSHDHDK